MKYSHFILLGVSGVAAMVVSGLTPARAKTPYIQFPSAVTTVADVRSPVFVQAEKDALALWKQGDRGQAKAMMYSQSTDAAPPDAAAAKLRLGYMNLADKNEAEAKRLFEAVADGPSGVNDAAKSEAAERLAYLALRNKHYDLCRARFQRLLSGEYKITNEKAADICHRLGSLARRLKDYQGGVPYFEAMAANAADPAQRAWGLSGLAGLWLDMANGDGVPPLPVEARPAAREKARAYCQQILSEVGPEPGKIVPLDRQMIAELMYFESYYFAKDYDRAYELGADFLTHWGNDPGAYDDSNMKIYLNTAKTFHTMNAYLTGHFEESLAIAEDLTTNKPPISERFRNFDAYMYGCTCGYLSAQALGRTADAQRYEGLAKDYNTRHFEALFPFLIKRTNDFVAAKKANEKKADKAVAQTNP